MDFHPESREKLQVVYERYTSGQFDLPELQQRLNSLRALLPNDIADDLERLLEQMELIRFTQPESNHMQQAEQLLKSFLSHHGVSR